MPLLNTSSENDGCKVAVEAISSIAEEVVSLLFSHYEETGIDPTIEYSPDWRAYLSYELTDSCVCVTARYKEILVGYAIYLIGPFKHNKHVQYADLDAVWISPAFRSGFLATKMLKLGEKHVAGKADYIMATSTTRYPIGALYAHMGFKPVEVVYWKKLGEVDGKQESASSPSVPSEHGTDTGLLELSEPTDTDSIVEPIPTASV